MRSFLEKEDYEEQCCLLNLRPNTEAIPVGRVMEKLDAYLAQNDYEAAERHLRYWKSEAEIGNDLRGKLTVLNEQIGLYRKIGREAECLSAVSEALALADVLDIPQTITYGTTLINAATGYCAFGKAEEALPLYRAAQKVYECTLRSDDERLGGLYNNTALALFALGSFREAEALYLKAVEVMSKQENGAAEVAITYLNLADLYAAEGTVESESGKIETCLQKAEALLNSDDLPQDAYYAFVCEKCAPVFEAYGDLQTAETLLRRARAIRERA